jgi:hypothetical protein
MLPDTITVNAGSPAADIVFGSPQRSGNSVSYVAVSPQGDLFGMRSLKYSSETTSKRIVRTLQGLRIPWYDTASASYKGEVTVNITVSRPELAPVTLTDYATEIAREAVTQALVAGAISANRL